jgi:hypothetical protein
MGRRVPPRLFTANVDPASWGGGYTVDISDTLTDPTVWAKWLPTVYGDIVVDFVFEGLTAGCNAV